MGKGRGVLDATYKLLCMAMYTAYILIGLSVGVIGVLYWSSTVVASGLVSALLVLSGLVMVGVGAAAIYGIHTDHVFLLSVIWCALRSRPRAFPRLNTLLANRPTACPGLPAQLCA
jgi:hypothetical protein